MTNNLPIPHLGIFAYRILHSYFIDALMTYRQEVRDAVLRSLEGVRFELFLLRLADRDNQRLRIRVKPEGDELWLGLDFLDMGEWVTALEVRAEALGVDPEVVMLEQRERMGAELAAILGGSA